MQTRCSRAMPGASKLSRLLTALGLAGGLALGAVPIGARADGLADVQQLMAAGKLPEALSQLDGLIAANPKGPQYKFLRGVILTEQHKTAEAIQVFNQLTEQFPELPEPYNNLAVLYASQGQYDKARAALEMAIRTNPSYATAFENLGDVYAKLASQSYQKALQLDPSKSDSTQTKLGLIRQLFSKPGESAPATVAAAKPVQPVPPAPPKPAAAKAPEAKPAPETKPAAETKPTPAPAAEPKAAEAPKAEAPSRDEAAAEAVSGAIHAWARAWASKDLGGYFAAYASDFVPSEGGSHASWVAQRKARIAGKSKITVEVLNLKVTVDGDKATAHFRQVYTAGSLRFNSPKTLHLRRSHGHWVIVQESVA